MLNPFTHRKILKKRMPGRATIVGGAVQGATPTIDMRNDPELRARIEQS